MSRVIFIISSGRSGSMSLAETLNDLPNIESFHGPTPRLEKENCLAFQEKLDHPKYEVVKAARLALVEETLARGNHYIESSWFLCSLIPELVQVFPQAEIFHLIRDGRDFVRSGMDREWFLNDEKYLASENSWSRDRWDPPSKLSRAEKIAWLWTIQQTQITKGMSSIPPINRGGTIKFEHLISSKLFHIILSRQMKLVLPKDLQFKDLNKTKAHIYPSHYAWSLGLTRDMHAIMGEELWKHNYRW